MICPLHQTSVFHAEDKTAVAQIALMDQLDNIVQNG